jgi:hypothetical protein
MASPLAPVTAVILLLLTALSGCLAGDTTKTTGDGGGGAGDGNGDGGSGNGTGGSGSGDGSGGGSGSGGNQTPQAPPPVLNVTISAPKLVINETEEGTVYEAPAGKPVSFNATNSTDPAGGNLSFAWDFGEGNTTTGAVASQVFIIGNFTVTVTATSNVTNASSTMSLNFMIFKGAREPVSHTDPSGDSPINYGDIRVITVSDDETTLKVKFTLGAVQPGAANEQVICFSVWLNNKRFETYSFMGTFYVYDYTKGGDVTGGDVKIVGTGYEMTMPIAELGTQFPMTVRMESRGGECGILGGNSNLRFDSAPDSGTFTYGA